MKKFSALLAFFFLFFTTILIAQPGALDNTFGGTGVVNTPVGPGNSQIWGMAVQTDQKIIAGGFAYNGRNMDFAAARYNENGALDTSFGTNGMVITAVGDSNDLAFALALQPDGKMLLGGFAWANGYYGFALVRYNTNGSVDSSFGTNGRVITAIGPGNAKAFAMGVQSDWSIVLGGSAFNGTNNNFALARYSTNGTLDPNFGNSGTLMTTIGTGDATVYALSVTSGWSVVVGGIAKNDTIDNFALARYDLAGTLVSNFGTNGKLLTPVTSGNNGIYALTEQTDGKILATGYAAATGAGRDFAIVRYDSLGVLDNNFATGGKAITQLGDSSEAAYAITQQPDGKIVTAGGMYSGAALNFGMVRYNTDGTPDNAFGSNGKVVTVASTGINLSYAVKIQADGKILSSGYANDGTHDNFSVIRYISGLSLGVIDFTAGQDVALIYPNPVGQTATLEYTLKNTEEISIKLVDMNGRTVETFATNQKQQAGDYKLPITFSPGIASGSYMIVISSASGSVTVKISK